MTDEVAAEIRATLLQIREELTTPVRVIENTDPPSEESLRDIRRAVDLSRSQPSQFMPMPRTHWTMDCGAALARLLALLEMSPGERGFIMEASDLNLQLKPLEVDQLIGVWCDWLIDHGREGETLQFRRVLLEDGDVLFLRPAPGHSMPHERMREFANEVREHLTSRGRKNVTVVVSHSVIENASRVNIGAMNALGWYYLGASGVGELVRLREENAALQEQLAREVSVRELYEDRRRSKDR